VSQVPIVAQHHSILAVNYLENYLNEQSFNFVNNKNKFRILPMRLGETGADRGIPNGVLNP
jgi:hypothetical protein